MNTDFQVGKAQIHLRPARADDAAFLSRVYASTRTEELEQVNWTDEQKAVFLQMQFDAQTDHYKKNYPTAEYLVVERDGLPIGRLTLERKPGQLLMMELSLLPEARNQGIGATLIQGLMDEAAGVGVPLVLRVEFFNPVIRLYTRLGFVKTREVNSVYHEMIWTPVSVAAPRA